MGVDKHITQNTLLQNNRIVIDPQTGVAYDSYRVSRSGGFVPGIDDFGTINVRTSRDADTHHYDCPASDTTTIETSSGTTDNRVG